MESALTLDGLSYRYPGAGSWTLRDINLRVRRNSFVVLAGPTGSGKSTILRVARGLYKEYGGELSGTIHVFGEDVTELPASALGSRIAVVFQNPSYQLHQLRVLDEIMSAPLYQGLPWKECLRRAEDISQEILPSGLLGRNPATLSLGQQQKVALAASLSMAAEIILLDEPFSYLDTQAKQEFVQTIKNLLAKDKTVVLATHDLEPVASFADSVVLVAEGRIVSQGTADEVLFSDAANDLLGRPIFIELGDRLFRAGIVDRHALSWQDLAESLALAPRGKCEKPLGAVSRRSGVPAISVSQVGYTYPDGSIGVRDASLEVQRGEILGIIGSSGCGKTTLARLMVGLLKPTGGSIEILGQKPRAISGVAEKVGYVTQNPTDMLFETTVFRECSFGPACLGIRSPEERVTSTLSMLGLMKYTDKDPHALSGGEQRLLSLADVLVNDPPILILDEPEFGLAPKSYSAIRSKIRALRDAGKTIVIITHDLETAAFLCDRIALMKDGAILGIGQTADMLTDRALLEEAGLRYLPFFCVWHSFASFERGSVTEQRLVDAVIDLCGQRAV